MGTTLGKYEILFPLSLPGSHAQVNLAIQKGFGGFRKLVILREVLKELEGDEAFHRSFMEEVKIVAAFHHPNVAEVYDLEAAEGKLLLATEFIPGATLDEIRAAFHNSKMRVPLGMVLMAVRDAALALHYAHTFTNPMGQSSPVVHGALSGRQIQLTFEGPTKVLDFGAPKRSAGARTPATDLAALGVVIPAALATAPSDTNFSSRADLTPELREVFARLTALDAAQRFASAGEFVKALEAAARSVIWRPEQSGALIQRMFGERQDEIRQLLAQLAGPTGTTALIPLSKIFAEGRAPNEASGYEATTPGTPMPTRPSERKVVAERKEPLDIGKEVTRAATSPAPELLAMASDVPEPLESGEPLEVPELPGPAEPPVLGEEPVDTAVRRSGDSLPKRSGGGASAVAKALGLLVLAALLSLILVVTKWSLDPEAIRSRSARLAHLLEGLSALPGFPGHDGKDNPLAVADAGAALVPLDAGGPEVGRASEGGHRADAGHRPDAGGAAPDAGPARAESPKEEPARAIRKKRHRFR